MTDVLVPCGDCRACCMGPAEVPLHPTLDDPALYERAIAGVIPRRGGRCVYLAADGCSIYETRPHACRTFDCRELARLHDELSAERKRFIEFLRPDDAAKQILEAGRERCES